MIEVKYFGLVAEQTQCNSEKLSISGSLLSQLHAQLRKKYQLSDLTYSIAVNQKIIDSLEEYQLQANDIVALLPPFAGG